MIDGPFAETKELIAGYWIIDVKSLDEAIAWMKRVPDPHEERWRDRDPPAVYELEDFGESPAIDRHRALGDEMAKKR